MTDFCKDFKPIKDMHSLKVNTKGFSKNFKIVSCAAFGNPNACVCELNIVLVVCQQSAITKPGKLGQTSCKQKCADNKKKVVALILLVIAVIIAAAAASQSDED